MSLQYANTIMMSLCYANIITFHYNIITSCLCDHIFMMLLYKANVSILYYDVIMLG